MFSPEVLAAYAVILGACPTARGQRWTIPVPAVGGALAQLVVDSRLNKWVAHEADRLVALPDAARWPLATAFVLRSSAETDASGQPRGACLHPSVAPAG